MVPDREVSVCSLVPSLSIQYLDPPAEYDSGSEGEGPAVTINTHTEEQLNNNKVSTDSPPMAVTI